MKNTALLCAAAMALSASAAMAAPTISFAGGSGALPGDTHVIENFDELGAGSPIGTGSYALDASNGAGARPAFGSSGNYASVLGGGAYAISFAPTSVLSFVLGSLDTYNSLTLHFADGSATTLDGGAIAGVTGPFPSGSQTAPATNGVVTYRTGSGAKISGATFKSSANSFEFDNISVAGAVPEPASWAMMIVGMGAIGATLRRRQPRLAYAF